MSPQISHEIFPAADRTHPERRHRARIHRGTKRPRPRYLLACWPEVAWLLRGARQLALFLDFDGTLVPLRRRPEDASLSESTRRLLRRLARHSRVKLYIISGRRRADLRWRVRVPGVSCLGLYGWERNGKPPSLGASRKPLEGARALVKERLRGLQGVWVEDKRLSLVVHYRGAPSEAIHRAEDVVMDVLECVGPRIRRLERLKAWEILPRQAEGKGPSVRKVLAELSDPVLPIYVGDDASDESAFAVLPQGLTVRVGASDQTKAGFFLRNPAEVTNFLERVEEQID